MNKSVSMNAINGETSKVISPLRLIASLLAVLFFADAIVLFMLQLFFHTSIGPVEYFADPLLLVLISAPFLWLLIARPLHTTAKEVERLNVKLVARTAELENANLELEAFNYSVAHDLRQPLNVISGYNQAIKEICGNNLDEQCKGYLQSNYEGTLRMNRLIEALLNFSRIGHVELQQDRLDLSSLAHEVVLMLKEAEPERKVVIRIAEGIVVNGDANLIRVVLENLLGNAWKYTGLREVAVIELGETDIDDNKVYFVRDNGSGFNMADADKLFAPFQRLPGAEKNRGFGIGLATVERIINRQGGRIWAEGEPGKGATFYFTLSVNDDPN
jgi:light-regulated signal transduction histidine kinase (bacteriophytochrome)